MSFRHHSLDALLPRTQQDSADYARMKGSTTTIETGVDRQVFTRGTQAYAQPRRFAKKAVA